jgi:CP family cyanate transporter-like MFS transporter
MPSSRPAPRPRAWRAQRGWLVLTAVVLLAFNLRSAAVSVGAVLEDVSTDLRLSPTTAGVLTTLPVVCFSAFGAVAARCAHRYGAWQVLAWALVAVVAGQVVRVLGSSSTLFLLASGVALAGMAIGNVVVPAFVKERFPRRVGLASAAYTTSLSAGTAIASGLTVPIGDSLGGWRYGLVVWAGTTAVALAAWVAFARDPAPRPGQPPATAAPGLRGPRGWRAAFRRRSAAVSGEPVPRLRRSTLAWSLAFYFGLQSLQAYAAFGWLPKIYRDAGLDPATAGLLVAVLPLMGIPLSLVIPVVAARGADQRRLVWLCGLAYVAGYVGLIVAPRGGALAWAVLLGLGGGAFPLALTLVGLRSRASAVTAALSGFSQSVGYLVAIVGPLELGALFDLTGGWTIPLCSLLLLVIPQVVTGLIAAEPTYVDDEIAPRPTGEAARSPASV